MHVHSSLKDSGTNYSMWHERYPVMILLKEYYPHLVLISTVSDWATESDAGSGWPTE